jgi:valyl-tRNA synthetase
MSKSKGNVVVPAEPIDNHGADGVRYWAASARLGTDAAFDEGQMKVGRRLAVKILNAAKFSLSFEVPAGHTEVTEPVDQSLLLALGDVVRDATAAFEAYDHTKALELAEHFFWNFTDNYLELVKERAYNASGTYTATQQASAAIALRRALHVMLRLFAPFLPYATDEVWSWWQTDEGSIHRASWPTVAETIEGTDPANAGLVALAQAALFHLRKAKSDAKVSMRAEVATATLNAPAADLAKIRVFESDLKSVGRIAELTLAEDTEVSMTDFVLAEQPEA